MVLVRTDDCNCHECGTRCDANPGTRGYGHESVGSWYAHRGHIITICYGCFWDPRPREPSGLDLFMGSAP